MKKPNKNYDAEKLRCWKTLKLYFDKYFKIGLCDLICFIEDEMGALDDYQSEYLYSEIEQYNFENNHKSRNWMFIWKKGDHRPRKRFINQKIKFYGKD